MCKIAMLPHTVRTEINHQLRDGTRQDTVAKWLFTQHAAKDIPDLGIKAGELYAMTWIRDTKNPAEAVKNCRHSLSAWYRGRYQRWLEGQERLDTLLKMVARIEELTKSATTGGAPAASAGAAVLVRSMLLSVLEDVFTGDKNPADIARLANAWARANQAGIETEKLRLHTQGAVDVGLDALYEEMKASPETMALFERLRDAVKQCPGQIP
jgi:hypothetical protein